MLKSKVDKTLQKHIKLISLQRHYKMRNLITIIRVLFLHFLELISDLYNANCKLVHANNIG